jgi:hypothetical protein
MCSRSASARVTVATGGSSAGAAAFRSPTLMCNAGPRERMTARSARAYERSSQSGGGSFTTVRIVVRVRWDRGRDRETSGRHPADVGCHPRQGPCLEIGGPWR